MAGHSFSAAMNSKNFCLQSRLIICYVCILSPSLSDYVCPCSDHLLHNLLLHCSNQENRPIRSLYSLYFSYVSPSTSCYISVVRIVQFCEDLKSIEFHESIIIQFEHSEIDYIQGNKVDLQPTAIVLFQSDSQVSC